jgi:hypothetical protein
MPSLAPGRFFGAKILIFQKEICSKRWFAVVSALRIVAKSSAAQRCAPH